MSRQCRKPTLQAKAKEPFLANTLTEQSDNKMDFLRILTNYKF
jgi:hypothetical protein